MTSFTYDEILLNSENFTELLRNSRLELLNNSLELPINVGQPESVQSTKIILTLVLMNPISIFEDIKISIDVPAVSDGEKFKIYDGISPSVASTPMFLDMVDPQGLANAMFIVRTAPFDFSSDPLDGKKFIPVSVNGNGPTSVRIEYSMQGDSDVITKRILGAFPMGENSTSTQALFSYTFKGGELNFGIMEYMVLNDPVLSLLYQNTTYGYQKLPDNIKLIRRNESEDVVKLYRINDDIRIEFEANDDESKKVLDKIMASLKYYWKKEEEVKSSFSQYDPKLIEGLELNTIKIAAFKPTYVPDGSPFTKLIKGQPAKKNQRSEFYLTKTFAPFPNQPKYNFNVAMQNNPGVSLETLKDLAKRNIVLDPVRWSQAVGELVEKDVFIFSEDGLIIPNSRLGLYSRSDGKRRAIFVFIKPNGGCMLIEENRTKKKPGKKYEQINEKNKPGDRYACMIPKLKPILGDKYQLRGVHGGSGPDGIAKCIQSGGAGLIPDDTVLDLYRKKTKFYAGSTPGIVGKPSESVDPTTQCVDENGKFSGKTPGQPFPNRPVVCNKDGVIYQFQKDKRYVDLLVQLCIWKYSNIQTDDEQMSVDDFAKNHLQVSSERIVFKPVFKDNDVHKIPVPDIEAIKYKLKESESRIVGKVMERFYRMGVYHEGNIIHMNNNNFAEWAQSMNNPGEKYYNEPVDTLDQYFLDIKGRIARATNITLEKVNLEKNATLIIYSNGNYSTYKEGTNRVVIGWKNKQGQRKFTFCKYVDDDDPPSDDDPPPSDDDDPPSYDDDPPSDDETDEEQETKLETEKKMYDRRAEQRKRAREAPPETKNPDGAIRLDVEESKENHRHTVGFSLSAFDDVPSDDDDDDVGLTPTDIRLAVADYAAVTESEKLAKRRAKGGIGKNPVPFEFWAHDKEFYIMSKIFGVCIYIYQLPYTFKLANGTEYASKNKWLRIGDACGFNLPKIAIHGNGRHFQILNPKRGDESFAAVDAAIQYKSEEADDASRLMTEIEENIALESDDDEVDFLENRLMAAKRAWENLEKSVESEAKRVENTEFQLQDVDRDGDCGYWAFIRATKNQEIQLI